MFDASAYIARTVAVSASGGLDALLDLDPADLDVRRRRERSVLAVGIGRTTRAPCTSAVDLVVADVAIDDDSLDAGTPETPQQVGHHAAGA